jgi:hypothetical protein
MSEAERSRVTEEMDKIVRLLKGVLASFERLQALLADRRV